MILQSHIFVTQIFCCIKKYTWGTVTSTHNSLVVSYTAAIRYTSNMAAVTVVDRMTSLSPNYIVLICIFFRLHFVKFSTFNLICTRESPPTTLPTFPAPEFFLEQPQSPQAITCRQIFHFSRLFWYWEKATLVDRHHLLSSSTGCSPWCLPRRDIQRRRPRWRKMRHGNPRRAQKNKEVKRRKGQNLPVCFKEKPHK